MSNIIETEKKKTDMLKEVIEKKRNLSEDALFRQDRAKDLSKNYVQHSICVFFEFRVILFRETGNHRFHQILFLSFLVYMESTTKLGQEDWRKKLDRGVDEVSF